MVREASRRPGDLPLRPRADLSRMWSDGAEGEARPALLRRRYRVDLGDLGGLELPLAGGRVRGDLIGLGGAGDHRRDVGLRRQPRDGEIEDAVPVVARPRGEGIDDVEVLVGQAAGGAIPPALQAGALRWRLAARVLAR